jgi:hypothetical protein
LATDPAKQQRASTIYTERINTLNISNPFENENREADLGSDPLKQLFEAAL